MKTAGTPVERATQILTDRIAAATSAAAITQPAFVAAILDVVENVQGDAVDGIRAALSELHAPLSQLIAADQIRLATIGDRYSVPAGRMPPFSGLTVYRKFVAAIPERFRAPGLEEINLLAAAHEISSRILAQIKDEPK